MPRCCVLVPGTEVCEASPDPTVPTAQRSEEYTTTLFLEGAQLPVRPREEEEEQQEGFPPVVGGWVRGGPEMRTDIPNGGFIAQVWGCVDESVIQCSI